jgi:hypothetical protein
MNLVHLLSLFAHGMQRLCYDSGIPGENNNVPQKYVLGGKANVDVQPMPQSQQTLTDATVEVVNGQTIMKFTKIMQESGEIPISPTANNNFMWAHGSGSSLGYHAAREVYVHNLSSGVSESSTNTINKAAWLAHGVMAFLAWGVCTPLAVQSALLRDLLPKGPIWFNIHRALNTLSYALFIALFALAIAYVQKEGDKHFNGAHERMGLAMFILATVQILGGVFRPHLPEAGDVKSVLRKGWEASHRAIGVALLACGFWQMRVGIELYAVKYNVDESEEDTFGIVYWVWVGLMSAIIVVGGAYFKLKKNDDAEEEVDKKGEGQSVMNDE